MNKTRTKEINQQSVKLKEITRGIWSTNKPTKLPNNCMNALFGTLDHSYNILIPLRNKFLYHSVLPKKI